jgi:hypothetical protein
VHPDQGKVALKYGPLIYNIEKVDQDIAKPFSMTAPLIREWRPDLLGGVMTPKSKFADGGDLLVPNFARANRGGEPNASPKPAAATRAPAHLIVWIKEGQGQPFGHLRGSVVISKNLLCGPFDGRLTDRLRRFADSLRLFVVWPELRQILAQVAQQRPALRGA